MKELSPYQITWAEFIPESGVVTAHDQKLFGSISVHPNMKNYRKSFPTRDAAVTYLKHFAKDIDKQYTVFLFTDKQFGLAKEENNYAIPYTQAQLNDKYFVHPLAPISSMVMTVYNNNQPMDYSWLRHLYKTMPYKERVEWAKKQLVDEYPYYSSRRIAVAAKELEYIVFKQI